MKNIRIMSWVLVVLLLLCSTGLNAGAEGERLPPPEIVKRVGQYGEYLTFGAYEQDNDFENGPEPIEWRVLKAEEGRVFVISLYALELMPYHNAIAMDKSITWENWSVRAWLNREFIETAFTAAEQERILTTTVEAQKTLNYETDPGNDTEDKVFLLSFSEAQSYLPSKTGRKCQPTAYAIANYETENQKVWDNTAMAYGKDGNCLWWLRSPGECDGSATLISADGSMGIMNSIREVEYICGVRPVMWIDLEP